MFGTLAICCLGLKFESLGFWDRGSLNYTAVSLHLNDSFGCFLFYLAINLKNIGQIVEYHYGWLRLSCFKHFACMVSFFKTKMFIGNC